MKQVFFISNGTVSLQKTATTTHKAEMHFYTNPQKITFDQAVEDFNWNGGDLNSALRLNREAAYKSSISPYSAGHSLYYFENIVEEGTNSPVSL